MAGLKIALASVILAVILSVTVAHHGGYSPGFDYDLNSGYGSYGYGHDFGYGGHRHGHQAYNGYNEYNGYNGYNGYGNSYVQRYDGYPSYGYEQSYVYKRK